MVNNGYVGKILQVDLSTGKTNIGKLDLDLAQRFIGGRGLATKILLDEIDPTVDPLSPDNKIIIAAGPLTGTIVPTSSRYMVVTKGPLTGAIACSNSGGFFGPELKFAGFDMIIIEGKSPKPLYLWIRDSQIELRSAEHIWGKNTDETEDILRNETHKDAKVACIGPAGESLVRFASIINDRGRAAARSGVGAVMGSKNLKAVVVRGTGRIKVSNSDALRVIQQDVLSILRKNPITSTHFPSFGTASLVNIINRNGLYPTRNFQTGVFANADKINGETLAKTIFVKKKACFRCPIACGRFTSVSGEKYKGKGEGPEAGCIGAMGANCGIDNLEAIARANYISNKLGLDQISFGTTLACAMELYEKGYLPEKEIGRTLNFGDADALVEMVGKTGRREGIGDILAEGSFKLAQKYGHSEFSMSVKKQELPPYDPRGAKGLGLGYATSNRGACHTRGYTISAEILGAPLKLDPFTVRGKAVLLRRFQDFTAVIDSAGICIFVTFALGMEHIQKFINAVIGFDYTIDNIMRIGERIWNIERVFNVKAGFTKEDDTLPERLLKEAMPEGPAKGNVVELDEMLKEYYNLRGWDLYGVPTEKKLKMLQLI